MPSPSTCCLPTPWISIIKRITAMMANKWTQHTRPSFPCLDFFIVCRITLFTFYGGVPVTSRRHFFCCMYPKMPFTLCTQLLSIQAFECFFAHHVPACFSQCAHGLFACHACFYVLGVGSKSVHGPADTHSIFN